MSVEQEMTKVPVLLNHDSTKPIGWLMVDESYLPPGMDYVFSLACEALEAKRVGDRIEVTRAKLCAVSLQTDDQYLAYLKSQGKA